MRTNFRIAENVSPNAVNFGRLEAPVATPVDVVVGYDFSGNHLDNVSTFPDREKMIPVQYDAPSQVWQMTNIYASDVKLTNRFLVKRGNNKQIPLYFKYVTNIPMVSQAGTFNDSTQSIDNLVSMKTEYEIISRDDSVSTDYLHDIDFIPYHIHNDLPFSPSFENVFYLCVFSNGSTSNRVHRIRYKAIRMDQLGLPVEGGYSEYLSVTRVMDMFNLNFEFKEGMGADLLGYSYDGALKNPMYQTDANALTTTITDPDATIGRKDTQYSLNYHYNSKSYIGMLTDKVKAYTPSMMKPIPWLSVYYQGTEDIVGGDVVRLDVDSTPGTPSILRLVMIEPGVGSKEFTFTISGKSSVQVAAMINSSRAPFTAYSILNLDAITLDKLWFEYDGSFEDTNQDPTAEQFYDVSSDGGILLRSSMYYARYTPEPTVRAYPPANHLTNKQQWFPRVKFGGFVDDEGRAYYVNEYSRQSWSNIHGFPYVDVAGEEVFLLDRQTIKCKFFPLANDINTVFLVDSLGDNQNHLIDGIDALRGLIFLKEPMKHINEMFLSYSFKQKYAEINEIDINPLPGHEGVVGQYYVVSVVPYINAEDVVSNTTIRIRASDNLPSSTHSGDELILAAFLITDKFNSITDYKIQLPKSRGGGLSKSLPLDVLNRKVPDLHSFFDVGYIDGLRYPANSVIMVTLPSFIKGGAASVLTREYSPDSAESDVLNIFGSLNIAPNTLLRIYSGEIGTSSYEESVIMGPVSHNSVRIKTPLTNSYNLGSPIVLSLSTKGIFDSEDINKIIRDFASTGTHFFTEYRTD